MKIGANMTVFILFFGVALIEALRQGDLLQAALFLLIGLVFLYGDTKKQKS